MKNFKFSPPILPFALETDIPAIRTQAIITCQSKVRKIYSSIPNTNPSLLHASGSVSANNSPNYCNQPRWNVQCTRYQNTHTYTRTRRLLSAHHTLRLVLSCVHYRKHVRTCSYLYLGYLTYTIKKGFLN